MTTLRERHIGIHSL